MRDVANLAAGRSGFVVVMPDGARRRGKQKCRQRKSYDKDSSGLRGEHATPSLLRGANSIT